MTASPLCCHFCGGPVDLVQRGWETGQHAYCSAHHVLVGTDPYVIGQEAIDYAEWLHNLPPEALIRWPWQALNELAGPLAPGRLTYVAAFPGGGKALALTTPLPTPTGWTTMGDVQVGDLLLDESGKPCTVTGISPIYVDHDVYDVVFDDGSVIRADRDHRWFTWTRKARHTRKAQPGVVTTWEILQTLRVEDGRLNHSVQTCAPLAMPHANLPVPPYVLGAWLGDGNSKSAAITISDADAEEVLGYLADDGVLVSGKPTRRPGAKCRTYPIGGHGRGRGAGKQGEWVLQAELRSLGVIGNKHIPAAYLRSSAEQRFALLQGLMDTDGSALRCGQAEFYTTSRRLADDVLELMHSLGFKTRIGTGRATVNGKDCGEKYRIKLTTKQPVFRLRRKRERLITREKGTQWQRYITDVRPVPREPVKCVSVDSPNRLYLAGKSMIPTHNTSFLTHCLYWWLSEGKTVTYLPLESDPGEVFVRLACLEVGASADEALSFRLADRKARGDEDAIRLHNELTVAYRLLRERRALLDALRILPIASLTVRAFTKSVAVAEAMESDLIVVDHVDHVEADVDEHTPEIQVSNALQAEALKAAKRLSIPVVLATQLNSSRTGNDRLAHYRPPSTDWLYNKGKKEQMAANILGLSRALRPGISPEWLSEVRAGTRPITDIVADNRMAVTGMKLRYGGAAKERTVMLAYERGRITDVDPSDQYETLAARHGVLLGSPSERRRAS